MPQFCQVVPLSMLTICVLCLAGCGKSPAKMLQGHWATENGKAHHYYDGTKHTYGTDPIVSPYIVLAESPSENLVIIKDSTNNDAGLIEVIIFGTDGNELKSTGIFPKVDPPLIMNMRRVDSKGAP